MKMPKGQPMLPALTNQTVQRQTAMREFYQMLENFDIFVTGENFTGEDATGVITCYLQAPTVYDVAVRLAKAGWIYTDATEDKAAPFLVGPLGEQVRITRGSTFAAMVYTPASAGVWTQDAKPPLAVAPSKPGRAAVAAVLEGYRNTGS